MFRLLNMLYNDVWLSYTLYDIIKTELADHNNLLSYLHDEPLVFEIKDDYVFIDTLGENKVEKFKLQNQMFQLNYLRSDMISWKQSKLNYTYTYADEVDWEYIHDPCNLPCNNYLLYLLENMPENITCNNIATVQKKNGWKRADEIGLEKEACVVLNRQQLGDADKENIWVDDRILGEKWRGLFSSVSPHDTYIEMAPPIMP